MRPSGKAACLLNKRWSQGLSDFCARARDGLFARLPWLAGPAWRRLGRFVVWSALILWLLFVVLVSALRFVILPKIADYRPEIEQAVSQAVGLPVSMGSLTARWQGLNPDLILGEVQVADRQGAQAFSLTRVEAVLSWQSLVHARPILDLLVFERPVLHVRRASDGRISVAGIAAEGEGDSTFADWALAQHRIRIRNASVVWDDQLRQAPPLVLEDLQFGLDNSGRRHRFGFSAAPPPALAARIEVRGEVKGDIGEALEHLAGKLFVELDYANLAGWRPWVDYPLNLPSGRGAVRLWGDLDDGAGKLTADLALEEVRARLGKTLPELDLASLRGRLLGTYKADEWSLTGRKIELQTHDGLRVAPSDFQLTWRQDVRAGTVSGEAGASFVDLGALAHLASYMPLDAHSRDLLTRHRPQGRVSDLRASWTMKDENLLRYSLKAGFSDLGMGADAYFPGAGGLSGSIDANEKSGVLLVDSGRSHIALPAVFPEPEIRFDRLRARASWRNADGASDVSLEKLEFASDDAAGSVNGKYRYTGDGPGEIDLQANLDRANAAAVWRYMPHVVNAEARAWLKRGLVAGKARDGRLLLRGDLRNFPFRDPATGVFSVTAKASEGKIDYAPGWPMIEGIEADMQFGVGMKIKANRGQVFGAALSGVSVEIPDFGAADQKLQVRGLAQGPSGEFLRFVGQSPIAEMIDRFTDGITATGDGSLDLALEIPLRHLRDTRVRADYKFLNNQVQLFAALPPITQVNGRLLITENSINATELSGRAFGGPLKAQIKSAGDRIAVQVGGNANVVDVSRHFGWPLLNHLTGSTPWKADVTVRKRNARIVIDSDLVGVTSPLPEPLNKNASTSLPLRIERTTLDSGRDQYRIGLGKVGQGLLLMRQDALERGVFAVGPTDLRVPDAGLSIRAIAPRVDADAWRYYLAGNGGQNGDQAALPLQLAIKTDVLRLFGRDYHLVEAGMRSREGGWQIALNTREAQGELLWKTAGEGSLEGGFRRLQIPPAAEASEGASSIINSLPALNLQVEDFRLGERALGRLELKARNERGAWRLDTLNLQNPDGMLTGKAVWQNAARHQTRLDFDLNAKDMGKLLDRLGYEEVVKSGSAHMSGNLQWGGPLTAIHYPSLTGNLRVEASKGQFHKLQPGVGKLLGLLSLQALPRRLTLDFRDIFSEGLAFDSIEGKLAVQSGVMRTQEPLRISGPAAQIEMEGETDLQKETQNLRVVVRPELGGIAAVGTAALLNPVVGAATLVANTVLQKPLNRLFSYRYRVTGTWSDPLVSKEGETPVEKAVKQPDIAPEEVKSE